MQTLVEYIEVQCADDGQATKTAKVEAAAKALGVSRATVYNNMRHGRVENDNLYVCAKLNQQVTE